MTQSVWKTGLLSLCPNCGQAPLFDGLLKIKPHCPACQADFSIEDAGDGPAVFVILVAGAICVPFILIAELALRPPMWLLITLALPFTAAVCLALLRPFKSLMFAMQWRYKAGEGQKAQKQAHD